MQSLKLKFEHAANPCALDINFWLWVWIIVLIGDDVHQRAKQKRRNKQRSCMPLRYGIKPS